MIWAVFVEPQHMLCTVSKYFVTCGNIIWDSLAALNRLWFRTIIDSNPELDNNFVRSLVQTLTFVALIEKCRVWSNSPSSSSFRVQHSVKVRILFGLSLCDGLPVTNCQAICFASFCCCSLNNVQARTSSWLGVLVHTKGTSLLTGCRCQNTMKHLRAETNLIL